MIYRLPLSVYLFHSPALKWHYNLILAFDLFFDSAEVLQEHITQPDVNLRNSISTVCLLLNLKQDWDWDYRKINLPVLTRKSGNRCNGKLSCTAFAVSQFSPCCVLCLFSDRIDDWVLKRSFENIRGTKMEFKEKSLSWNWNCFVRILFRFR